MKNILFVPLLCMFISACSPNGQKIGEISLFSDESCKAPCFWNIYPGETRISQVWDILENKGINDDCNKSENSTTINCSFSNNGYNGEISEISIGIGEQDDIVKGIFISPKKIIHISDVISEYSGPTWVTVWKGKSPENFKDAVNTEIIFEKYHILLLMEREDMTYSNIQPTSIIFALHYLSDAMYHDVIEAYRVKLQDWKDYGMYSA